MKFFTGYEPFSNYTLLHPKYINKLDDIVKEKKEVLVDPGVHELKKRSEYSKVNKMHSLVGKLPDNCWISIDYPCDMNVKLTDLFIRRSIDNNIRYASKRDYICTIQSKFLDWRHFIKKAEELRPIWEQDFKMIGIGNMCKVTYPNRFTDKVTRYIIEEMRGKRVHFYGLSMPNIRRYARYLESSVELSVDQTKWTRPRNKKLPSRTCRQDERDIYFLNYVRSIVKVKVEW